MNNTNDSAMELLDNARLYDTIETDDKIILVLKALKAEDNAIYTDNKDLIDSIILLDDSITKGLNAMDSAITNNLLENRKELISDLLNASNVARAIIDKIDMYKLCVYCNKNSEGYVQSLHSSNMELDLIIDVENKQMKAYNEDGKLVTSLEINYCPMCNRKL